MQESFWNLYLSWINDYVVIGTSLLVSPANTLTACSGANYNIVIDPGEVEVPEGFLHIKETATVGMEMLYNSLKNLAQSR